MLNKYYRCKLNVSWTESNSSHEILALATCRIFLLVAMMIGNDLQRIPNAGV